MKKKPKKKHWQIFIDQHGQKCKRPYCEDAKKAIEKYKENQIVNGTIVGETDQRSVRQLGLYWQACKYAAERIDDIDWSTSEHVDFQLRMCLKFFDNDYVFFDSAKNQVSLKLLSISFDNLTHIDACDYFSNAYEVLANKIPGSDTVDEMIENIKKSCKGV